MYLAVISFITLGALFAKHRVEETMHYQRVREIIYVLETGFLSDVLGDQIPENIKSLIDRKTIEINSKIIK